MSDVFVMNGWPDEELICQLFYEIHDRDQKQTRDHFRDIFYKLHWQTPAVYNAADRDPACRRETLSFIDRLIFGDPAGKCPYC